MKLLSVAIPSYNSAAYMSKCIESLLPGGEDVEILVIDDGSKDDTGKIADEYEKKYPGIVRAIHQENAGHGGAVNAGIANATGLFFKVVDSDDWVGAEAYQKVLDTLRELAGGEHTLDMLISNFVYDKVDVNRHKVMQYRHAFPQGRIFGWEEIKHLNVGQYILMHSVIFRTKLLRECGVKLPEHTFYVDNLFVFEPLPAVKNMYYLDANFYHYYIGREDQSVNEKVMISRIDQQIRVNKQMIDFMASLKPKTMNKDLRKYMLKYLTIITTVSSIMMIRSGTEENLAKKKELWQYLKKADLFLYHRLRYSFLGSYINLPGPGGRRISVTTYKICRRFFNFN